MYVERNGLNGFDFEALLTKGVNLLDKAKQIKTALKSPKKSKVPAMTVQPPPAAGFMGLSPVHLALIAVALGGAVYMATRKRR